MVPPVGILYADRHSFSTKVCRFDEVVRREEKVMASLDLRTQEWFLERVRCSRL